MPLPSSSCGKTWHKAPRMTDLNMFLFFFDSILGAALVFYHVIRAEEQIALRDRQE